MKKNLFILALFCVVGVLAFVLWFKEDFKKDSVTISPKSAIGQISKPKTSTKVESKTTKAPVAPKKEEGVLIETAVTFGFASDAKKGEEGQ
ncbi:MAG: hypothetical protein NT041_00025 [Candidatus Vogelbacteria bacterium]|nr:hypothetical protein [Candidatus Vogelbacteria bacterium]